MICRRRERGERVGCRRVRSRWWTAIARGLRMKICWASPLQEVWHERDAGLDCCCGGGDWEFGIWTDSESGSGGGKSKAKHFYHRDHRGHRGSQNINTFTTKDPKDHEGSQMQNIFTTGDTEEHGERRLQNPHFWQHRPKVGHPGSESGEIVTLGPGWMSSRQPYVTHHRGHRDSRGSQSPHFWLHRPEVGHPE